MNIIGDRPSNQVLLPNKKIGMPLTSDFISALCNKISFVSSHSFLRTELSRGKSLSPNTNINPLPQHARNNNKKAAR